MSLATGTCMTIKACVLTVSCQTCGLRPSTVIHIVKGLYYCPGCCPDHRAEGEKHETTTLATR